jgi:hypothetical protein
VEEPAEQEEHTDEPGRDVCPAGHISQEYEPDNDAKVPTLQGKQEILPLYDE